MKTRLLLLLFMMTLLIPSSFAEEVSSISLTLSASQADVTVYLNSDKIGTAPAVHSVSPGEYVVEYVVTPGNRLEHKFSVESESVVFVFGDIIDRSVTVLRSEDEIQSFLNEFSVRIKFKEYFDEAMRLYKRGKLREAIEALEAGLTCCYSDAGRLLLKEWRKKLLPDEFVYFDGGTFNMGIDIDEARLTNATPAHEVRVKDFATFDNEVTIGEFSEFVKDSGYETVAELAGTSKVWDKKAREFNEVENASWKYPKGRQVKYKRNDPVAHISWYDAVAYCKWYALKNEYKDGEVYLPTEAQWEYVARGSSGRMFPWGLADPVKNTSLAIVNSDSVVKVGSRSKGSSPEKINDLIGNVWEWSADYGDLLFYASCKKNGVADNPSGAKIGMKRAIRGGGFDSTGIEVSSTTRRFRRPDYTAENLGFRLAFNFCGCGK